MTPTLLDDLEALAKAATPGPWVVELDQYDKDEDEPFVMGVYGPVMEGESARYNGRPRIIETDCGHYPPEIHDAAFIAAANPAAILSLVAEVRRLRLSDEDRRCLAWARTQIEVPPPAEPSGTRKGALEVLARIAELARLGEGT
jgi:hypothetical protein